MPVSPPETVILEAMAATPTLDPCTEYLRRTTRKYEFDKYAPRQRAANILQR